MGATWLASLTIRVDGLLPQLPDGVEYWILCPKTTSHGINSKNSEPRLQSERGSTAALSEMQQSPSVGLRLVPHQTQIVGNGHARKCLNYLPRIASTTSLSSAGLFWPVPGRSRTQACPRPSDSVPPGPCIGTMPGGFLFPQASA